MKLLLAASRVERLVGGSDLLHSLAGAYEQFYYPGVIKFKRADNKLYDLAALDNPGYFYTARSADWIPFLYNDGHRIFGSSQLRVPLQYVGGFSGGHLGKDVLVRLYKNRLKDVGGQPLLLTPHFAVADRAERTAMLKKWKTAHDSSLIHNPGFLINKYPNYLGVFTNASGPVLNIVLGHYIPVDMTKQPLLSSTNRSVITPQQRFKQINLAVNKPYLYKKYKYVGIKDPKVITNPFIKFLNKQFNRDIEPMEVSQEYNYDFKG